MIFYKTHPARKTRKLTQESILPCSPWHQSSPHCAPVSQKWICRLEDGGKTEGRFFCVLFSTKEPSPCVLHLFLQRQSIPLPAHGRVIGNDMLVLLFYYKKQSTSSFQTGTLLFTVCSRLCDKRTIPRAHKKASSPAPPLAQNTDTFQPVSALVSTPDVPRR